MPKGIPGCLLVTTDSDIKLRLFAELKYLGANEYTRRTLSVFTLGNFSHKNESAGPFLCSSFKKMFMRPNLIFIVSFRSFNC